MKQTMQIFSEGESATVGIYITISYELKLILVLLLLEHRNFFCKCHISWCNAYWRGTALLRGLDTYFNASFQRCG